MSTLNICGGYEIPVDNIKSWEVKKIDGRWCGIIHMNDDKTDIVLKVVPDNRIKANIYMRKLFLTGRCD